VVSIKAVKKYYLLYQLVSNYKRKQKKLNNNQSGKLTNQNAKERRNDDARGIPYPTKMILD